MTPRPELRVQRRQPREQGWPRAEVHVPGGRQGADPREEHRRLHLHVQPQGQVPVIPFNVAWASGVFEVQDSFQGLKRWKETKKGHLLLPEPTIIQPRGRPPPGEEKVTPAGEAMGTGQLHQAATGTSPWCHPSSNDAPQLTTRTILSLQTRMERNSRMIL